MKCENESFSRGPLHSAGVVPRITWSGKLPSGVRSRHLERLSLRKSSQIEFQIEIQVELMANHWKFIGNSWEILCMSLHFAVKLSSFLAFGLLRDAVGLIHLRSAQRRREGGEVDAHLAGESQTRILIHKDSYLF